MCHIFLIEKVITFRANEPTVMKVRSSYLLVAVNNKITRGNIIKMKFFNNLKCKGYPHKRFNNTKGVVGNRELSLAARE